MNSIVPESLSQNIISPTPVVRAWPASIDLLFRRHGGKTALQRAAHHGPLRVQRPFYPEAEGCCHVYLLHPPGGMVIGDALAISASLEAQCHALITTPSAGKVYGAKGDHHIQQQQVHLQVADAAVLEWLPQETIIFNSANARLQTRVDLAASAGFAGWDILRLGRAASGERFLQGSCHQRFELWREGKPLHIERNQIEAGADLQHAVWGLRGHNTFGTLLITTQLEAALIDDLLSQLNGLSGSGSEQWGLTQKKSVFMARYLGDDVSLCRQGFELVWRLARPYFNGREAVSPRIWAT